MAVYNLLYLILYIYQLSLHNCTTITCIHQNCTNQDITCSSNTNCEINCIHQKSCAYSRIYGATNNALTINCIGNSSCLGISIYCPTSTNNIKNCFLKENDNSNTNIQIYAINGWQDINIEPTTSLTQSPGSMHCDYNYTSQCTIQTDWSCTNNQCYQITNTTSKSPNNFIQTYMIIIGCVIGIPIIAFFIYTITKICIQICTKKQIKSEQQRHNIKSHQKNANNNTYTMPPDSQIADTGKLEIPNDTEVDMTITIDTTHNKHITVSDPSKKFSRYASVVYTGSPLANINEPKSTVEIEIDTNHYMKQLTNAAEQIQSDGKSKKIKKKRFQNRNSYKAKVNQVVTEDDLTTPLTPENNGMDNDYNEQQIEIDLNAYDLDEIDENKIQYSPYAKAARDSTLKIARTSSLRNLDKKDMDKFKQLGVYHESLIEDVVMSKDIMTPNSPFSPQKI